jgi:thiazolinyl imide reductase
MKRLRVLVCGTNYGRIYLDAIALKPSRYELAGILAVGSARSRKVAAQHRAPLFHNVEELPGDIHLACAAMGSSGSDAVLALLDRGIHVVCEHPLRPAYLDAALARASKQNLCFHLNAHLAMLPAARKFIAECRSLLNGKPPAFVSVMATDRSLYATTDLLRHLLQDSPVFHLESRSVIPQFTILNGSFGPTGTSFQIQGSMSSDGTIRPDGGPGYLVDCRVAVATSAGMLTLMSINGPVVWNANYGGAKPATSALWKFVGTRTPPNARQLYSQRVRANLDSMDAIARHRNGQPAPDNQTPEHILAVSRLWEDLCVKSSSEWLLA